MKWVDSFVLQELKPYEINMKFKAIKDILNGRVSFSADDNNMDGFLTTRTFLSAATDERIDHNLGSIPTGYITLKSSNGGVIYDGVLRADKRSIYLRSTTPNHTVTIFIAR
jgi:hypothetical protein